jgi:hypothetical protein
MPAEPRLPDGEQPPTQQPPPHPVDRMAEIKALIAALDLEYARLRDQVLTGKVSTIGALWEARVTAVTRRTIAVADAQRLLPLDLFEALVKPIEQTNVTLRRRRPPKPVKPPRQPQIARMGRKKRGYRGFGRTMH